MKDSQYSILIVDDEPANVRLLSCALADSYVVKEALSGAEALEIIDSGEHPVMVLLDVMMPEIDGFEVCRRLKDNDETKDIMVIFVTAMGDSAAEELGLNLGAVDYITKPIRLPIVRARVRNHMNARRKTDILEAMSYIDGLTHVHNRRRFDQALISEWQRGLRSSSPLALVMIDFDHFKALNDHYGHGTGDICLQQGASALTRTLQRPSDMLARYGGEEFVALLPGTDRDGAAAIAEAMRAAVAALKFEHKYSQTDSYVTISLGVAAAIPSAQMRPAELLEMADQALNQAKSQGRNQVCLAPPIDTITGTAEAARGSEPWVPPLPPPELPNPQLVPTSIWQPTHADQQQALQAPFHIIFSNLERLDISKLNEDQQRYIDELRASALSLKALIDEIFEPSTESVPAPTPPAPEPAPAPAPTLTYTPCAKERFDHHELMHRVGEDSEIAAEVIAQFLKDAPVRIAQLQQFLEQADFEQVRFKAHSLKGLAGNISARDLLRLAETLENAGSNESTAAAVTTELAREYEQLALALQHWMTVHAPT